jgi:hypothetical protein
MANLLGQNIGTNYKGFLNLDTTINTSLDSIYRTITDGMGNNSALELMIVNAVNPNGFIRVNTLYNATSGVYLAVQGNVIGDFRVDATNGFAMVAQGSYPISFYTNNTAVLAGRFTAVGELQLTSTRNNITSTSSLFSINTTFAAAAGTGSFRPLSISYTINNSGAQTGTATGIFLNATETALNGMGHFLIDLQRGAVSQFSVTRTGNVTIAQTIEAGGFISSSTFLQGNTLRLSLGGRIIPISDGVLNLTNVIGDNFTRLCFGGTSNLFPALVRQNNTLEVRTADGISYAQMHAGSYAMSGYTFASLSTRYLIDQDSRGVVFISNVGLKSSNVANDASAILDIASTTKGVLFPRMTTTEVNNIGTPADGLVVYNTTIGHLCVRAAGVWHKLSQSTM